VKPGRNQPCPCGSQKKYKACCGRIGPQADGADGAGGADDAGLAALLHAGRYAELENKARELLRRHPTSGLAWQVLGVALSMQGKDPLHALQRATQLLPDDPGAHSDLGNALAGARQMNAALASYRRALALDPNFAAAHSNLGNALRSLGQFDAAVASYRRALALNPDFAEAHNNLGNALLDLGQPDAAATSYQRALALNPDFAEAHNNLGNAWRDLGQLQDALSCYQRALVLSPDFPEAHHNLGNALRGLGRLDESIASYRRALGLRPAFAEAHNNLGNALLDLGQLEEAEASYRRAVAIKPDFADAHSNLGIALRMRGLAEEAEVSCRRALDINPRLAAALPVLAELHADRGQFAEAEQLLQRAIAIDPLSPEGWAGIARLKKMTSDDAGWLAQAQRIAAQRLLPRQELLLRYAIGKYFDDVGDFDQAFVNYRRANELSQQCRSRHSRAQLTQAADRIISGYRRDWVLRPRSGASTSARPVLVVGMPRSGTTLVEQIIASHPMAFGAGELPFWSAAAATVQAPALHADAGDRIIGKLADDYLRVLAELSAPAARVVDKMPANFLWLGLIHAALPSARIIHLQRNPLDTCLSIYFQHFESAYSYANDLGDLAHAYTEYRRVMAHWRAILPAGAMLEVPYEALVADQETWTRRMLEFIGLPWDARCIDFHQTIRPVMTTSRWQVRQKISSASVERWRHYEKFIGPLLELAQADARG
jgi:tetratricopeptide (TPR) repeat protein